MKVIVCRREAGNDSARAATRAAAPGDAAELGAPWVRFGDELVLLAGDEEGQEVADRAAARGFQAEERAGSIRRENLHLVVQKGRLFEEEYREQFGEQPRILTNRGRFLLVDLDPDRARSLERGDVPCYSIRSLEENQVVFDRPARAAGRAPIAAIQTLADRVTRTGFRSDLETLVNFGTRLSTRPEYLQAADHCRRELADLGCQTRVEPVTIPSGGTSQNVIAERAGSAAAGRQVVLVTAHLDSVNHGGGPAAPAPGADDNASGSAGVLQIARVLEGHAGQHDLRLILFGGEEQGLHGSLQYVASLPQSERDRIRAVVNMDMIGTLNVAPASVLVEGAAVSQAVIDGLVDAAATYTSLVVETSLNPFNSDHVPFIRKQIPAVLTIEGADQQNQNAHTGNDTPDRISDELAVEILRMNVAFVAQSLA